MILKVPATFCGRERWWWDAGWEAKMKMAGEDLFAPVLARVDDFNAMISTAPSNKTPCPLLPPRAGGKKERRASRRKERNTCSSLHKERPLLSFHLPRETRLVNGRCYDQQLEYRPQGHFPHVGPGLNSPRLVYQQQAVRVRSGFGIFERMCHRHPGHHDQHPQQRLHSRRICIAVFV